MPGADESGELADATLAADILLEAGGEPEAAASDRAGTAKRETAPKAEKRKPAPARESDDEEATDETSEELDTETEAVESDEDADGENDQENAEDESTAEAADDTTAETVADDTATAAAKDDTPEWAKKRFGELTGQIRQLKQENDQLRQASTGSNAPVRPAVSDLDILSAETPEQLARLRESFEQVEEFAELNPDGVEADPDKPDAKPFTRDQIAQARFNARRKLREIGQREKQLEHQQKFNAAAHTLYPALNEPDSVESAALKHVLQQVPELRRLPGYRIIIGDAIAGERLRTKAAQAAAAAKKSPNGQPLSGKPAAPAARKAPPAVNGAPSRGSAAPAGKVAQRQKARTRAMNSGSEADIADLVEASLG